MKNNLGIIGLCLLLMLGGCEKDLPIQGSGEDGVIDSVIVVDTDIVVIEDTITTLSDTIIINVEDDIFVPMTEVLGLWQLIYYHATNGPLWDSACEDLTHLGLTPNNCYMNTNTGGNVLVVDGWWVAYIHNFDGNYMVLKRYTDDGWAELYIFERIL
tara:strand:+ start:862 stop:1332 length:471 start_codon:yes stop_codon:yes gene_type:complete